MVTTWPSPLASPCAHGDDPYGARTPLYAGAVTTPSDAVGAILLTGGASRRMGRDKSLLIVDGVTLARRTAGLLERVVATAIEVGPGHSGLVATRENPAGEGPLAAIAAGRELLREMGSSGAALVVAVDLPFLDEPLVRFLTDYDAPGSVLPIVEGRSQPLCARWAPEDLDAAADLLARGVRSLRHLELAPDVTLVAEASWGAVVNAAAFFDVDSPEDLERFGLS